MYDSAGECDAPVHPLVRVGEWVHCPTIPDGFLRHGSDSAHSSGGACSECLRSTPHHTRDGDGFHHFSLALFFTVREWIPGQSRHSLVLERRQGKLIFTPRGKANVSLALTYLGLQGTQSQFRLDLQLDGHTRRVEVEVQTTWEAGKALAEFIPHLSPQTFQLTLQIVSATAERVRVQLITPMRIVYEGIWDTLGFNFLEMAEAEDTPE